MRHVSIDGITDISIRMDLEHYDFFINSETLCIHSNPKMLHCSYRRDFGSEVTIWYDNGLRHRSRAVGIHTCGVAAFSLCAREPENKTDGRTDGGNLRVRFFHLYLSIMLTGLFNRRDTSETLANAREKPERSFGTRVLQVEIDII